MGIIMKILYRIPYPGAIGADRWIYEGWRNAFCALGHRFYELTHFHNIEQRTEEVQPDILMISANINIVKNGSILQKIKRRGVCIFLLIDWPRSSKEINIIKKEDIADIYFGEREPESMKEFERATGRKYHLIPNAADKNIHFPVKPQKKYDYDIVYLGAKLPKKKWFFDNVLLPLKKKYKVGIFGPYWTASDNILRGIQKLSRSLKLTEFANMVNARRISIPPQEERQLYSSAKISLNFHERESDGSQPHYILNQRTFKIPACGGFQICDEVPALRKYFTEKEVVMAKLDPEDWFKKIDYYLKNAKEREKIRQAGAKRALKEHTYHNRVKQVIELTQP